MSGDTKRYWGNVLESYSAGMMQDWRLRMAIDILREQGGALFQAMALDYTNPDNSSVHATPSAAMLVTYILDLADELVKQATERDLIRDLPDDNKIDARLRKHIERNVRAQLVQNFAGQKLTAEEAPPDIQRAPSVPPFPARQQ